MHLHGSIRKQSEKSKDVRSDRIASEQSSLLQSSCFGCTCPALHFMSDSRTSEDPRCAKAPRGCTDAPHRRPRCGEARLSSAPFQCRQGFLEMVWSGRMLRFFWHLSLEGVLLNIGLRLGLQGFPAHKVMQDRHETL